MPWRDVSVMRQREEFVALAQQPGVNRRELCRRFGISAQTGYRWLHRAATAGAGWSADRSHRPQSSPGRSDPALEAAVLSLRDTHPAWGARKLRHCLGRKGMAPLPAASTVHAILVRHGRIKETPSAGVAPGRFEYPAPNLVWQMDFKGPVTMRRERRCHPLTVVDDHSRYALCLSACDNQKSETVRARLVSTFQRYGLPEAFLVDNGSPWADSGGSWTHFEIWLMKLGIAVIHARPYHPQTRGKNERFHRTLKAELLNLRRFRDLADAQAAFDRWRHGYNHERPHQALDFAVPASRYQPSPRAMPDRPAEPEYGPDDIVRRVGTTKGYISFKGRRWRIPDAFFGERLAIRPIAAADGCFGVFFATHQITTIDLRNSDNELQ